MFSSRQLSDLHPVLQEQCRQFIEACAKKGIEVIITSTLRDNEAQAALYSQGRSRPGPKVTNARPGTSAHNYGLAFDFCPIVNGKADWQNIDTFRQCGSIAESLGLEWAGRWGYFAELAHCQNLLGVSLNEWRDKTTNTSSHALS